MGRKRCPGVKYYVTITIEYEPGVVTDLKQAISRLAPPDLPYGHELVRYDGNGRGHVQAALLSLFISMPI